jgi:hypothetical protein
VDGGCLSFVSKIEINNLEQSLYILLIKEKQFKNNVL